MVRASEGLPVSDRNTLALLSAVTSRRWHDRPTGATLTPRPATGLPNPPTFRKERTMSTTPLSAREGYMQNISGEDSAPDDSGPAIRATRQRDLRCHGQVHGRR